MSVSSLFSVFAKMVVCEQRIPFEITTKKAYQNSYRCSWQFFIPNSPNSSFVMSKK